jgi:hypothetical protein
MPSSDHSTGDRGFAASLIDSLQNRRADSQHSQPVLSGKDE